MTQHCLHLKAPLNGFASPINQVPDPVFAEKIVGDGIAIDPISNALKAPCDATVINIHKAKHAISLKTAQGIELLLHIGIDTVFLHGEGLNPKVAAGEHVKQGQTLIEFDADYLAVKAKSLLTTLVVTNLSSFAEQNIKLTPQYGQIDAETSEILSINFSTKHNDKTSKEVENSLLSEELQIIYPQGLHARPAASLAHLAKSIPGQVHLFSKGQTIDAKSMIAIMGLNLQKGDSIQFEVKSCCPNEAHKAIEALSSAIKQGLGETELLTSDTQNSEPYSTNKVENEDIEKQSLKGIAASQGIVSGYIYQLQKQELRYTETAKDIQQEHSKLHTSLERCRKELQKLVDSLKKDKPEQANIFQAHSELLDDPGLIAQTEKLIQLGKSAAYSWSAVIEEHKKKLKNLQNTFLASRIVDLADVRSRLLNDLLGISEQKQSLPEQAIIVATELTPSDTVHLNKQKVVGFCTTLGGASSHVAIIARAMGLPAITAIGEQALSLKNGTLVILDGHRGLLDANVTQHKLERLERVSQAEQNKREAANLSKNQPAITIDNERIKVAANIGSIEEAINAQQAGAEGIGLLRSEFLYFDKTQEPSEQEQQDIYQSIAQNINGQSLTIRTLDVGGDKPLPYIQHPEEDNPSLGERGIRMSLNSPQILTKQLNAILKSAHNKQIRILFPMVANIDEFLQAKSIVSKLCQTLSCPRPKLGIMIEVPSSALLAQHFAQHVDFFSIGTNDLTQYTLAMDRTHPLLASHIDGLHPAVLQLISMTVKGAKLHNKPVSICGCMASDPKAVPILIGLGIKELSVAVPILPLIKSQIRQLSFKHCQSLALQALKQSDALAVRQLINSYTEAL